jgi:preprotein translocase subunit SecG
MVVHRKALLTKRFFREGFTHMTAGQMLLLVLLFITSVFLIVLVLIQRGKGGGLAGALGGMGGQSAFGTKAGDLFTKITVGVAAFWIALCLLAGWGFIPKTIRKTTTTQQQVEEKAKTDAPAEKTEGKSEGTPSDPATPPAK